MRRCAISVLVSWSVSTRSACCGLTASITRGSSIIYRKALDYDWFRKHTKIKYQRDQRVPPLPELVLAAQRQLQVNLDLNNQLLLQQTALTIQNVAMQQSMKTASVMPGDKTRGAPEGCVEFCLSTLQIVWIINVRASCSTLLPSGLTT